MSIFGNDDDQEKHDDVNEDTGVNKDIIREAEHKMADGTSFYGYVAIEMAKAYLMQNGGYFADKDEVDTVLDSVDLFITRLHERQL